MRPNVKNDNAHVVWQCRIGKHVVAFCCTACCCNMLQQCMAMNSMAPAQSSLVPNYIQPGHADAGKTVAALVPSKVPAPTPKLWCYAPSPVQWPDLNCLAAGNPKHVVIRLQGCNAGNAKHHKNKRDRVTSWSGNKSSLWFESRTPSADQPNWSNQSFWQGHFWEPLPPPDAHSTKVRKLNGKLDILGTQLLS